jgi:hypothetical protein
LTKGAASVVFEVITSFPTLKASTLSYVEKVLIVAIYWSRRFVVHVGEVLSIEPFKGRERSILIVPSVK